MANSPSEVVLVASLDGRNYVHQGVNVVNHDEPTEGTVPHNCEGHNVAQQLAEDNQRREANSRRLEALSVDQRVSFVLAHEEQETHFVGDHRSEEREDTGDGQVLEVSGRVGKSEDHEHSEILEIGHSQNPDRTIRSGVHEIKVLFLPKAVHCFESQDEAEDGTCHEQERGKDLGVWVCGFSHKIELKLFAQSVDFDFCSLEVSLGLRRNWNCSNSKVCCPCPTL
jgi:hypothetical protein